MEAVIWTVAREEKFQHVSVYPKHLPFSSFIARCSWSSLLNVKANIRKQYEHWWGLYLQVSLSMIIKLESAWSAKICLSGLHCFQMIVKVKKKEWEKKKKKKKVACLQTSTKLPLFQEGKQRMGKSVNSATATKYWWLGPGPGHHWPRRRYLKVRLKVFLMKGGGRPDGWDDECLLWPLSSAKLWGDLGEAALPVPQRDGCCGEAALPCLLSRVQVFPEHWGIPCSAGAPLCFSLAGFNSQACLWLSCQ